MRLFYPLLFTVFMIANTALIAQNAWINEFHYDNDGSDEGEFIEVVIENASSYNLSDFVVYFYNGSNGSVYGSASLDQFTAGDVVGDFSIFYYDYVGIQNGAPDGFALVYNNSVIAGQFLSYEGNFTATEGPANGMNSIDIGVSESDATLVGYSLQLGGNGTTYDAFTWQNAQENTKGSINTNQTFPSGVLPEPSNHVTLFQVDSVQMQSVFLSWTGAVGDVLPSSYLILGRIGAGNFPEVTDGNFIAADNDWSDSVAAFIVLHNDGQNTYTVENLLPQTRYVFRIYPFNNSETDVDYKTDGVIPEVSATTEAAPVVTIREIQETPDGQEGDSPLYGQLVQTSGVVTAKKPNTGFWIQDAAAPWCGIYVYASDWTNSVSLGDSVLVTGMVGENWGRTNIEDIIRLEILETSLEVPAPLLISTGELSQEKYEGVLVKVDQAECTKPDRGHGEWEVDDGSGPAVIDDWLFAFTPDSGEAYAITGPVEFSFGDFKIEPRSAADIVWLTNAPMIAEIGRSALVPAADEDFVDTVRVTDSDGMVVAAELHYIVNGGDEQVVNMTPVDDSIYVGAISAAAYNDGDLVEYWIYARDDDAQESLSKTQGFFAGITPIGSLKQIDEDGVLLYRGYYARTEGVATVASGVFDKSNLNIYIQNEVYQAINVFAPGAASVSILPLNKYQVTGKLEQYNGLAELVPEDAERDIVQVGEVDSIIPMEINISTLLSAPEDLEGLLIKINNVDKLEGGDNWPNSGSNANLYISDDGGTTQMILRIDKDTDIDGSSEPVWPISVVGIFNQYDSQSPYFGGYQIIPRSLADIFPSTSIQGDNAAQLPKDIELYAAYPNPFNPVTTISFYLPRSQKVDMYIFNSMGQKVATLLQAEQRTAGMQMVKWQGKNDYGKRVSSGIYYVILKAQTRSWTQKIVLLK